MKRVMNQMAEARRGFCIERCRAGGGAASQQRMAQRYMACVITGAAVVRWRGKGGSAVVAGRVGGGGVCEVVVKEKCGSGYNHRHGR